MTDSWPTFWFDGCLRRARKFSDRFSWIQRGGGHETVEVQQVGDFGMPWLERVMGIEPT